MSSSLTEAEAYEQALRILAKTDGLEGVCAYGELVWGHKPRPHHKRLLTAILEAYRDKQDTIILMPAGAAKTTWGNSAFLSHRIAIDPNIRVGLFSQTEEFAESFSSAIMNVYEQNDVHRELFGDLVNGGKWTKGAWIRKGSNVAQTKDYTLFAGGTGGQVASKRFDLLLLDDILGKDNTETVDQRQKVKDWFDLALYPRMASTGVCVIVGTRWAPEDLYETLMKPKEEGGYGFRSIVMQAINMVDVDDTSTWTSYWPEVWSMDRLLELRSRNPASFDAVMQNDIAGLMSGEIFQRSWFRKDGFYYGTRDGDPHADLPTGLYTIRTGVDLAFSTKDRADFTARVTTAEDRDGNFWIMRTHRAKIETGHEDFVVAGYLEFPGIGAVIVESVQAQSVVTKRIIAEHPEIPLIEHKTDNDKRSRGVALAERYRLGKVHHHASLQDGDLEREELSFDGKRGHDDLVDSAGFSTAIGGSPFFFGVMKPGGKRRPELVGRAP